MKWTRSRNPPLKTARVGHPAKGILKVLNKVRLGNRMRDSHICTPAATTDLMISARSAGEP